MYIRLIQYYYSQKVYLIKPAAFNPADLTDKQTKD